MTNALIIENGFATIATPYGRIETARLSEGRYVRIDDSTPGRADARYPQLCVGASRRGATIDFSTPEQLARDCDAKLYKTRAGFDRAAARIEATA